MKKYGLLLTTFVVLLIFFGSCSSMDSESISLSSAEDFPDCYNVIWTSPSLNSAGSMPVGGGDTGCNVWIENDQLKFYFQRSGIHDEYNGFPKLGRVSLWSEPNLFLGYSSFSQELVLSEGIVKIFAEHPIHGNIQISLSVDVHNPEIFLQVSSSKDVRCFAQYESWRTEPRALDPNSNLGERWGWWDIEGLPQEIELEADKFIQEENGLYFYHVNPDEKISSRLAYETMGLGDQYGKYYDPLKDLVWGGYIGGENWQYIGTDSGRYQTIPYKAWQFQTKTVGKQHQISIIMHTDNVSDEKRWKGDLDVERVKLKDNIEERFVNSKKWWKDFWNRSYIMINKDEPSASDTAWQAGRNYNLFRYMTACNAYGNNPTMFNGGLFTFDPKLVKNFFSSYHPDWRRWGGGNYTLQNQRWVYWPMLKWGDSEHMTIQFDHFLRTLDVAKMRVREKYGHEGALYSEPSTVYGLPFPMLYGFEKSTIAKRQRAPWFEDGLAGSVAIRNHHTASLEFSYMVLEYYRYTGKDISRWLPVVKATLDFYDQHYRIRSKRNCGVELDQNGKLILFPTSVCEAHFYATNAVPDVAGLQAVVESVKGLPSKWIAKYFNGKADVERISQSIPDFHYEMIDGKKVLAPARSVSYPDIHKNNEIYLNYPMFPFNRVKLGDPEMDTIRNAHDVWTRWQPAESWTAHVSWTNANVAYARMGEAKKAAELTIKKLEDGPYRFPAFWGPGYDWAPDHNWGGTGVVGVQEMLMQAVDDKIVLMPAWPSEWDVDFRLNAPQNTVVTGSIKNGELISVDVFPESRRRDLVIYKK